MPPRAKAPSASQKVAQPEEPQYKFKIVVVGDPAVGKTSLIRRYVFGDFDPRRTRSMETQVATRGAFLDLSYLGLTLSRRRDPFPVEGGRKDMHIDLLIWDILGQTKEKPRKRDRPFEGARGVVAVADLSRPDTLDSLDTWVEGVYDVAGPVPTVLFGNKADLPAQDAIPEGAVSRSAWAFDCPYFLTSAKTGFNVDAGFEGLAKTIYVDMLTKKLE